MYNISTEFRFFQTLFSTTLYARVFYFNVTRCPMSCVFLFMAAARNLRPFNDSHSDVMKRTHYGRQNIAHYGGMPCCLGIESSA